MKDEKPQEQAPSPRDGIPAPLLENLHEANEQFRRAREHVEQANGALVNPFEERKHASQEIRDAEKAVEQIEEKIEKALRKTDNAASADH